jgi:negative regulator of sigma E activity
MTFDDETLMAYTDGELDPATRAAIEAAMAVDPALAQRVAQHQALRSRLRSAFDPVLSEPIPERVLAAARGAAAPAQPARVIPLRRTPTARWSWPQLGALAASLVLGVLLGPWLLRTPAPLVTRDGVLLAGDALARALSQQLASTQPADAPVQIGVTFRSRTGDYCRTFVLHEKSALAGLACHEHGAWRLEALAASEATRETGGYRAAASALPPGVAGTLDTLIAGEPLDARAEAAAREHGWSP